MIETPACKHEHTRLIAKDNEAEYIECADCGAILETHELPEASKVAKTESAPPESPKPNPFDESLSDA
jgi:transcription initiation factor TFIIIB Brf1 subunit/transcription initiation factor TFIIB